MDFGKNDFLKKNIPIITYVMVMLIFLFVMSNSSQTNQTSTQVEVNYSTMVSLFEDEQVSSFELKDDVVTMALSKPYEDKSIAVCNVTSAELFYDDLGELVSEQSKNGIISSYNYSKDSGESVLVKWGPTLVMAVASVIIIYLLTSKTPVADMEAFDFGKAKVSTTENMNDKVTFNDVAGAKEEKEELSEIVDFLKNPLKYTDLGARIPKGVILVGPPGTGKTLLAKAVAGEADVPFYSISGSDFVEMFVGVGASRVRDLFEQAKNNSPSIVFIDEIDAVGRRRGSGIGGGHDEREQTLNQLLVEMDGFAGNSGVIVIAATNRVDILDPALLRPGRFDRQIHIGMPDIKGREEILRVHSRKKPLADDVNLKNLARATSGFTGADLENLMNEGALNAARNDRPVINMKDLQDSIIKVLAGPEKKSAVVSEKARTLTAYHEAGHAVAMYFLPTHDPVHQITIVPRGQAGGMTIYLPDEDKDFLSRTELNEQIVSLLGGRVAEDIILHDISTGASNDLERATSIARKMVTKYGMSDKIGTVVYSNRTSESYMGVPMSENKDYSEQTANDIDREISNLINSAYERCKSILQEHLYELDKVAKYLLENETMTREEFEQVFKDRNSELNLI